MPRLTVFAGINGAGKTTLYNYLAEGKFMEEMGKRVCPDEILQDFKGDWRDDADLYKSSRIALRKIKENIEKKSSFNWETTLISVTILKYIKKAKEQGFQITVNFIGVGALQQSLERIKMRMKKGGHGVDKRLVEMRFQRQFDNFRQVFDVADGILFYDNADTMRVVGTFLKDKLYFAEHPPKWTESIMMEFLKRTKIEPIVKNQEEIKVKKPKLVFDKVVGENPPPSVKYEINEKDREIIRK